MAWTEGSATGFTDVLQALIDFCCGNKYNESIGAAPLQTLNFTLSNTPVAKGQARANLKQDVDEFSVWDNGEGEFIHPDITSSTLNYLTGVGQIVLAAALPTGFTADCDYVVGKNGGEEGRDWMLLQDRDTTDNLGANPYSPGEARECWMKNSGVTYKEPIYIGFREFFYVPSTLYNWNINIDHQLGIPPDDDAEWNFNKTETGRSGYSTLQENWTLLPSIGLRDDSMYYWIFSNKNRIMGAVRVTGTVYETFYAGFGFRFSSPVNYNYPLLAIGSLYGNLNYANTSTAHVYIIDGDNYQLMLWNPQNDVYTNMAFQKMYPKESGFTATGTYVKGSNGKILLWPIFLTGYTGSVWQLLMELDGVYFGMDNIFQSEDKVQIAAQDYLVIQNIFRTNYHDYLLMKME
jgi:hypothetical protein